MSDEQEKRVTNPREQGDELSTTGRLMNYNEQLKRELNKGLDFTRQLDQLITTTDPHELLAAADKLTAFQLNSAYLVYPQQFSKADYYLIFLNRLLQQHQNETVTLRADEDADELYHEFPEIMEDGHFAFTFADSTEQGAYYTERTTGNALFYLNFQEKVMRINSHAVTNLMVLDYTKRYHFEVIHRFEKYLLAIGQYLQQDFDFDVDFSVLDPANGHFHPFRRVGRPEQALDKLFILASNAGRMLTTSGANDAVLDLGMGTSVQITADPNGKAVQWGLIVTDDQQQVSWFDLLFKYEFLRDWYMENIETLEIAADSRYFGD